MRVGRQIKNRVRSKIGEWISCNVGIGTNRFLAKLAASLHKPDGLDQVSHENMEAVYAASELLDLCGINTRYQARLNIRGIYTSTQFLRAPLHVLKKSGLPLDQRLLLVSPPTRVRGRSGGLRSQELRSAVRAQASNE